MQPNRALKVQKMPLQAAGSAASEYVNPLGDQGGKSRPRKPRKEAVSSRGKPKRAVEVGAEA